MNPEYHACLSIQQLCTDGILYFFFQDKDCKSNFFSQNRKLIFKNLIYCSSIFLFATNSKTIIIDRKCECLHTEVILKSTPKLLI